MTRQLYTLGLEREEAVRTRSASSSPPHRTKVLSPPPLSPTDIPACAQSRTRRARSRTTETGDATHGAGRKAGEQQHYEMMLRRFRLGAVASAALAVLLHCRWVLLNGASVPYRLWTVLGTLGTRGSSRILSRFGRHRSHDLADPLGSMLQSERSLPSCGRSSSSRPNISQLRSALLSVARWSPPLFPFFPRAVHPLPAWSWKVQGRF